MSIARHELILEDHSKRIGTLEVKQAVLIDNMSVIRKLGYSAIALLSGIFLTLLGSVLSLLFGGWVE